MPYLIGLALVLLLVFGPSMWVKHVLAKYNRNEYFSGTGAEFARMALEQIGLPGVAVEVHDGPDHYDLDQKIIRLGREHGNRKSLAAVVVAAHEIGHAIQDHGQYAPLVASQKIQTAGHRAGRIGAGLMIAMPIVSAITRVPASGLLMLAVAVFALGIPVVIRLISLPVEWDASFSKALPMLEREGWIPSEDIPRARRILSAASLTYVAAALIDMVQFWRWLRYIR